MTLDFLNATDVRELTPEEAQAHAEVVHEMLAALVSARFMRDFWVGQLYHTALADELVGYAGIIFRVDARAWQAR